MAGADQEILIEFARESQGLVQECVEILEAIEDDHAQLPRLENYANRIDRVMGAARSIAMLETDNHALHVIGDSAALCKALGYRCLASSPSAELIDTTVAFLMDATELVGDLLERLDEEGGELRAEMKETFVERLRWISDLYAKFPAPASAGEQIEALLKKLGMS